MQPSIKSHNGPQILEVPKTYSELAKQVYSTGEKEGWTTQQIFQMLSEPTKFHKFIEKKFRTQNPLYQTQAPAVISRLVEDDTMRRQKRHQIQEQNEKQRQQQELQQIRSQERKTSRDNEQFLSDQVRFEQKRVNKLVKLYQEERQKDNYKVELNNKSILLAQKRRNLSPGMDQSSLHMRLYKEHQEMTQRKLKNAIKQFQSPQSTMDRGKLSPHEIIKRVYNEAIAKQQKSIDESKYQNSLLSFNNRSTAQASQKSKLIIGRRLNEELLKELAEQNLNFNSALTRDQTRNLLESLGFFEKLSASDLRLVNYLTDILIPSDANPADQEQCMISVSNLKSVLWAILNLDKIQQQSSYQNLKNPQQFETSVDQTTLIHNESIKVGKNLEFDEEGNIKLAARDCKWLASHFQQLAKNRQDFLNQQKKSLRQHKAVSASPNRVNTFRPNLSPRTQNLASKKLQQLLQNFNGLHHDYLIDQGQRLKKEKEMISKKHKEDEVQGLMFSPQILKQNRSASRRHLSVQAEKRKRYQNLTKWEELYQMGLEKPKHDDRKEDEIMFEKEREEYTFHPNAHSTFNESPFRSARSDRKSSPGKDVPTSLRNENTKLRKRPKMNVKAQQVVNKDEIDSDTPQEEEQTAILFIDVNLGEGNKPRIILHSGDQPEQVAGTFAKKHKLDEQMKQKLILMLKDQLSKVLTQINESSESD